MLVTYFDEVKFNPPSRPFYWLGGIAIPASLIRELEGQVAELAVECFGGSALSRETEFHATDIYGRRNNFRRWNDVSRRMDVLKRLFRIIDRRGEVYKISIQIEPAKMLKPTEIEAWAFIFLVERLDQLLAAKGEIGLLIGDYENESITSQAAEKLSMFRDGRTPYFFGQKIAHIVDTVHFSRSHVSRLLQLADLYVWMLQFQHCGSHDQYPGSELIAFLRDETQLLYPDKFKHWPTGDSWYPTAPESL